MSGETTLPAACDDNGYELSKHTLKVAIKWLVWEHGMTDEEAATVMARVKGHDGPTRHRQRHEAIEVADFVEHLGHV